MNKTILLMSLAVSASFATRIGVLKGPEATCNETITITLDAEDDNNKTAVLSGNKNLPGITLGSRVTFTYCAINVDKMPQVGFDYAVLRLDDYCPTGSDGYHVYGFERHHDTEDTKNANSHTGNIKPNVVDNNATLKYCFVTKISDPALNYPFKEKDYGVFANPENTTNMAHSLFVFDDEDSGHKVKVGRRCWDKPIYRDALGRAGCESSTCWYSGTEKKCEDIYEYPNNNSWEILNAVGDNDERSSKGISARNAANRIKNIMYSEIDEYNHDDTYFHVVKWTGSSKAILAKAAHIASSDQSSNNQISGVTSNAASIKGISRTAVNIELQSAGDVQISIVGLNGTTFAKISKQNMQPGSYSINWDSSNIPNGRYTVVTKQNGIVRAKNVILK